MAQPMGWMQKLCEVYDVVSSVDIPEEENHVQLVRVGFVKKKIQYLVTITAGGAFSSVSVLDEEERECIVPATPEARTRTGDKGTPFPLAESLKYFAEEALLDQYLAQLKDWCAQPEAPQCLRTLWEYLAGRTLLDDMRGKLPKGLKLHRNEGAKDFGGPDARAIVCFGVEDPASLEMRLWKREDVQASWSAYNARKEAGKTALCYATGETLPVCAHYPKVQGNAKLISAKDTGFPFQYKGRFVEDRSAATISAYAVERADHALQYLLDNQGLSFRDYGLNIVAWDVRNGAAIRVPLNESEYDKDADEDDIERPDTFEKYAKALCEAIMGRGRSVKAFKDLVANLADGEERAAAVIILSMEAATDGRMSIDYYQELSNNLYVNRILDWYRSCCWTYRGKEKGKYVVCTPSPLTIANAIMGADAVSRATASKRAKDEEIPQFRHEAVSSAKKDPKRAKGEAKQLCALYKRLLSCIVDGAALPRNLLNSAVHRAEAPLSFHDGEGNWQRFAWNICLRTACALIRRSRFDALPQEARADSDGQLPSDQLDRDNRSRDYLYGRLFALGDMVECEASEQLKQRALPTNAIRLMQRFVQRPKETWPHLHAKLLPYLAALGADNKADRFMRLIADVESLFERQDRESATALGEDFLLGYLAQCRDLYTKQSAPDQQQAKEAEYRFGADRSERFGMLAAVADHLERFATLEERGERTVSTHEGNTAALRMMVQLTHQPAATWPEIHARLLPYWEKLGIRASARFIAMLRAIEGGFERAERLDNAPLNSLFLHGFYRMYACLRSGGKAALETQTAQDAPWTRDRAYAALLAMENKVERIVLDMEMREEENRASNALRFMNKFASAPASTWRYLEERMRPYLRKLRSKRRGCAQNLEERAGILRKAIRENGWDSDEPLSSGWLHEYYTAEPTDQ